jgi:hypothetical protein
MSLPVIRITNQGAVDHEEPSRSRQIRSLIALFGLYAFVLSFVMVFVSDGANIGSILAAIGGHALYASAREALAWREASWLEAVRARVLRRPLA